MRVSTRLSTRAHKPCKCIKLHKGEENDGNDDDDDDGDDDDDDSDGRPEEGEQKRKELGGERTTPGILTVRI